MSESPAEYFFDNISDLINLIYDLLSFSPTEEPDEKALNLSSLRLVRKKIRSYIPLQKHFYRLCEIEFITLPEGLVLDEKIIRSLYLDTTQKNLAERLVTKKNRSIFLEGPAGTGKTHTVETILSKLYERKNFPVINTSTTGCSALLLQDGTTIDSALGNGLRNYLDSKNPNAYKDPFQYGILTANIMMNSKDPRLASKVTNIKEAKVIRIDEVSMMSAADFHYFSAIVSKICGIFSSPFGGKILILTGDLFQIPPIPTKFGPDKKQIVPFTDKFFIESDQWKRSGIRTISLSFSYRQLRDRQYSQILDRMRFGSVTPDDIKILSSRIISSPEERKKIQKDNTIIKIFSRNPDVDSFNELALNSIDEKDEFIPIEQMIHIPDMGVGEMMEKHLNSLKLSTIRLRKGCRIMITFNQSLSRGVVNGRTGVYHGLTFYRGFPHSMRIIFDGDTNETPVTRQSYSAKNSKGELIYSISQFPVRLGYALTIDKSQGASLEKISADTSTIFGEGRAYVLFSRVSKLENIHLLNFSPEKIIANKDMVRMFSQSEKKKVGKENSLSTVSNEDFLKKASFFSKKLEEKMKGGNDQEVSSQNKKLKLEQEVIDLD